MKDRLLTLITDAIKRLNETRKEKIPTDNVLDIRLYGDAGVFDSMLLVSFLALVEEGLEDDFDVAISLTSEKAVSMRVSPFSRVSRLIDFIQEEMALAEGAELEHGAADEPAMQGG